MDRIEEVFVSLFSRLREDLREESGVGLALKVEGRNVTLRIRSEKKTGDERRPYFAVVVGVGEKDGSFRVSYNPSGVLSAERQVTVVDAASIDGLLGLVRGYVEAERRRLIDYQQSC
ncbi:MAG: hypothetical protein JOZ63_20865 [Planctomycetaceae bacterium]|nr:hypothetical protein [Planctomycetaceae bacterium]